MDRHNRPYRCEEVGCHVTRGFGSKGELTRHINSVHEKRVRQCPEPGCSYSCPRKDNLQEHITRIHRNRIPEQPDTLQGVRIFPTGDQSLSISDFSGRASPANQVDVTVRGTRKRRRGLEPALSLENTDSVNEDRRDLQEEIEDLRRKLVAAEREIELYKKMEKIYLATIESTQNGQTK